MASSDAQVRHGVSDLPAFDFGSTPMTPAPELGSARVALVTTAGLRPDGLGTWCDGQGFVTLDSTRRDLTLAHISPNFDRAGLAAVASSHIAFMGAQPDHTLTTMRLDTGPAAAKLLLDDGVDVVVLTPV